MATRTTRPPNLLTVAKSARSNADFAMISATVEALQATIDAGTPSGKIAHALLTWLTASNARITSAISYWKWRNAIRTEPPRDTGPGKVAALLMTLPDGVSAPAPTDDNPSATYKVGETARIILTGGSAQLAAFRRLFHQSAL